MTNQKFPLSSKVEEGGAVGAGIFVRIELVLQSIIATRDGLSNS